jgi:hypothetical protein
MQIPACGIWRLIPERLIPERLIPSRGGSAALWIRGREAVALFEKSRARNTVSITRDHDFGTVNVFYHILYHWSEGEEEPWRLSC